MPHFFISYAKKDTRDLALQLNEALNKLPNVTAWLDKSLKAGQNWELEIQSQIDHCDYMIVLYSPDINRHKNGQDESYMLSEIHYAKRIAHKQIIPVMAQATEPPMSLIMEQYIDFTLPSLRLDDLVVAVLEHVGVTDSSISGLTSLEEIKTHTNDETPNLVSPELSAQTVPSLNKDEISYSSLKDIELNLENLAQKKERIPSLSIFISYAKKNSQQIEPLVKFLKASGHKVWFDAALESNGGQQWWDIILKNIRETELFVFALTKESLASRPCIEEYTYASKCNKRILPVTIDHYNYDFLPSELRSIQVVNFLDVRGEKWLNESIANLPLFGKIPNKLPIPPKLPMHRIVSIWEQIRSNEPLPYNTHVLLIVEMELMLYDDEKVETVLPVLQDLKNRDDFPAKLMRKVDELLSKNF